MSPYEKGREAAHFAQNDNDPAMLPLDSPEWRNELVALAASQDQIRTLAAQGNEQAAIQAKYLDGFLSAWD